MDWICVNERLPELEEIVLAVLITPNERLNHPYREPVLVLYRREHNYSTGRVIRWERPFGGETVDYSEKVAYWMPIPQIPYV